MKSCSLWPGFLQNNLQAVELEGCRKIGMFPWESLEGALTAGSSWEFKFPTQKHQTHLERESRTQGEFASAGIRSKSQSRPCSSTSAQAELSHIQLPKLVWKESPGELYKSAIPQLMSSYFAELREGKLTWRFPTGITISGVCYVDQKEKIPAVSLKSELSFGFRPGIHPTLSG